ncbi:MAG: hypothetical protein HY078_00395 [Elusimicrobia bacterium]|nr:hypothetical protein [Elusimicrobiota bacterium]
MTHIPRGTKSVLVLISGVLALASAARAHADPDATLRQTYLPDGMFYEGPYPDPFYRGTVGDPNRRPDGAGPSAPAHRDGEPRTNPAAPRTPAPRGLAPTGAAVELLNSAGVDTQPQAPEIGRLIPVVRCWPRDSVQGITPKGIAAVNRAHDQARRTNSSAVAIIRADRSLVNNVDYKIVRDWVCPEDNF